ncbi:cytoskeleton-associated protein 4 [Symphorus nematophorus]
MTAKNRHKNNSSEKSQAASSQDDASKKSQKSSASNGVSGPAPQGPKSGSFLGLLASAVFYIALIGAAGFAAFHLQQVVEEMRQMSAKNEESARQNAELGTKMDSVVQQVESLRSVVDGLESALGITRVELEGAIARMKRGEVETRRVEEALQKLQNDLLRDLSAGISEVKEAREKDFSSLEKTVEERLAEVSQSITASVAEFTEAQGESQSQLADLKARLGDMEDPTLIKQELSAIVETVAEIKNAKEASDSSADSLREQIGAVRAELQTRNQEVASLSQEIETVRSVVQETVGSLRQSLSSADVEVQALKDKSLTLESSVERVAEAAHNAEKQANEAIAQVKKQSEDLEVRVKASEESGDSLSASVSDLTIKVESLLTKYDDHESTLASQGEAVERVKTRLQQEIEELKSSLDEQMRDLERRLEDSSDRTDPEQLQSLKSMVAGLEAKAAKLEGHDKAIATLQQALQDTTRTLAGLSKDGKKKK